MPFEKNPNGGCPRITTGYNYDECEFVAEVSGGICSSSYSLRKATKEEYAECIRLRKERNPHKYSFNEIMDMWKETNEEKDGESKMLHGKGKLTITTEDDCVDLYDNNILDLIMLFERDGYVRHIEFEHEKEGNIWLVIPASYVFIGLSKISDLGFESKIEAGKLKIKVRG